MSSIVSAMDTAMQHVRVLSERKGLFPQLPGVLGGVSPGLSAFFGDCWDFKKTVSLQITCPFRAALQPMTNKSGAYRLFLPSFG